MIKLKVVAVVRRFQKTGRFGAGCNSSIITLIPKVKDPFVLCDFSPTSLISCFYKIVEKLLAERLKVCYEGVGG